VAKAGWQVSRAQVALIGARPRLGGRVEDIRIRIGELLALGEDEVSVTASTGNLNGAEGAGRVITATALVSVVRR
jgi:2C-methyl-D-erythritol 2,4-cyclodiphosphate synthase